MLTAMLRPLCRLREGEDIVKNATILNKASLRVMNEVREKRPNSGTNHFGKDFISGSKERNKAPLSELLSVSSFPDEANQT